MLTNQRLRYKTIKGWRMGFIKAYSKFKIKQKHWNVKIYIKDISSLFSVESWRIGSNPESSSFRSWCHFCFFPLSLYFKYIFSTLNSPKYYGSTFVFLVFHESFDNYLKYFTSFLDKLDHYQALVRGEGCNIYFFTFRF